jgi:BMFP domain-containing protein YqiC
MMIDPKRIEKIKEEIFTKYPEFRGVEPKISEKTVTPQEAIYAKLDMGVPKQLKSIYRLKFERTVRAADETPIERILLVTLDENFEIVKIVESR